MYILASIITVYRTFHCPSNHNRFHTRICFHIDYKYSTLIRYPSVKTTVEINKMYKAYTIYQKEVGAGQMHLINLYPTIRQTLNQRSSSMRRGRAV